MLFALWVVDGARGYAGELVFQSGFEPASRVVSSGADADIVGKEQATGMSGDWVQDPAPDGVSDFNPMKLYTSRRLLEHMKSRGKTLQIYWDDFELWKNRRPGRGHWIDRFDQLSGDS
jgi:hypothetical protein